jgi:hypothetical protein
VLPGAALISRILESEFTDILCFLAVKENDISEMQSVSLFENLDIHRISHKAVVFGL